jgi:hypothetical protein
MASITIPNNWRPRAYQMPMWSYLENGGKRAVEVWHRRAGKDEVALHWTAVSALEKPGNYWHMLPEFSHGRRALWEAVNPHSGKKRIDEAFPPEIRKGKANETGMRIELISGSVWHIVGSDNFDALVGSPPRGVVLSEWALADPRAWGFIEPILEENGGWAIFPYTPRGNNHGKTMYDHAAKTEGWFGQLLRADQTDVFQPEQLERIRLGLINIYGDTEGQALFDQEYNCSFEGCVPGAYYAKQMAEARAEGRIGLVPWDRSIEVDTFWDLGIDDSMSIWFIQSVGKEFRVIDYYENTGYGLEHYSKVMQDKGYKYGNHYMPHDAEVREMGSGEIAKSRREIAEGLGIRPIQVAERAKNIDVIINVHIPAVRMILPFCRFDEKKCARGISALDGYRAEYDEIKKKLANRPSHTWESHASDAFRTFAVGYEPQLRSLTIGSKDHQQAEEWNPLDF